MYAPETLVLTSSGHKPLSELDGHMVDVWNGEEFSLVLVGQAGKDKPLVTVVFDTGAEITCTPDQTMFVQNGYFDHTISRKRVAEALPGEKIVKSEFPLLEHGTELIPNAYTHGFYTGAERFKRRPGVVSRLAIYGGRRPCLDELDLDPRTDKTNLYFTTEMLGDFEVPLSTKYSLESKLEWLAGLFDSGLIKRKIGSQPMWHLYSNNFQFLKDMKLFMQTLGSDVRVVKNEDMNRLEYTLRFSGRPMQNLRKLGVPAKYITIPEVSYKRRGVGYPRIVSIIDNNRRDTVYTLMEKKTHRAVFNGILNATQ
jgi:ribonucleoside-diphosphate reductase alpha chain